MKEVFDRLRKRMEESSFPTTDNYVAVWYDDAISNINEEEKKWEKECSNGDLVSKRALLEEWDRQSSRGHYEFDQTIMTFPSYRKDEEVQKKDKEFCEWKKPAHGDYMITQCNGKHILSYKGYAHCPYCSNPIKFVNINTKFEKVAQKDSECRAYLHTYKCDKKSCNGCEYRYYADSPANKAIDAFANRMISMMPGHRQDIMKVAEALKEVN